MRVLLHHGVAVRLANIDGSRSASLLFYGPLGVGKATAAADLARRLSCPSNHGEAEAGCPVCHQFGAGVYPDFYCLQPTDKPSITIEQVRRLVVTLSARSYQPQLVRTVLVDDAHLLTLDAQNALLKLIEEPPTRTLIILVTAQPQALLDTVRSRLAALYFPPPSVEATKAWLTERHPELGSAAAELVAVAAGAPGRALVLAADPDAATAQRKLVSAAQTTLTATRFDRLRLAAELVEAKAEALRFTALLQAEFTQRLLAGELLAARVASALTALERCRRRLAAGVATRVALECLMLGLEL